LRAFIEGTGGAKRDLLIDAVYPGYADKDPARELYALYARDARWKYILYTRDVEESANKEFLRIQHRFCPFPARKQGDEDLFDLHNDPYERTNVASLAENRDRRQAMRRRVLDWWATTGGAELPLKFDETPDRSAATRTAATVH